MLNRISILSDLFFFFSSGSAFNSYNENYNSFSIKTQYDITYSESNARGKAIKLCSFETLNNKRWKTSVSGCSMFTIPKVSTRLAMISALPHTLL